LPILGEVALAAALVWGIHYLRYALTYESTDDAFVAAHLVAVSAKVANYVSWALVDDNQHVNQEDLLVGLDPQDFEARLAQAKANLAAAVTQHQTAVINTEVVETTSAAGVSLAEPACRRPDGRWPRRAARRPMRGPSSRRPRPRRRARRQT